MKKMSIALALMLCAALLPVYADDSRITEDSTDVISVYGYIGPDTETVPTDPEEPPALEVYVEVPMKIQFAAFESDGGAVTSPRFRITNLSEQNDIKVEIESFTQRDDPAAELGNRLTLNLTDNTGANIITAIFPSSGTTRLLTGCLPKRTEGSDDNRLEFMVNGMWIGDFTETIQPVFDMTVVFSAVT